MPPTQRGGKKKKGKKRGGGHGGAAGGGNSGGTGVPNAKDRRQWLLILCSSKDEPDIRKVRALLDGGADVRARGPMRMTALMGALDHGHTDAAKVLLEADPSIGHVRMTSNKGMTAMMCASYGGNQGGVTPHSRCRHARGCHFPYNDFPHRNPMGAPRKVDSHPVNICKS